MANTHRFITEFASLLQTKQSIGNQVKKIIPMISVFKDKINSKVNRKVVDKSLNYINDLMELLKCGILVHQMMLTGTVPDCEGLLKILYNKIQKIQTWTDMGEKQCQFLRSSIIFPYFNYLRKRFMSSPVHSNHKCRRMFIIENKSKIIRNDQSGFSGFDNNQDCFNLHLEQSYRLINLLNKCSAFVLPLIKLIRYYGSNNGCILDLNKSLGLDAKGLYDTLIGHFQAMFSSLEPKQEIQLLLSQIEIANEKLYFIYYNFYYGSHLRICTPKFIKTDLLLSKLQQNSKKSTNRIIKFKSLPAIEQLRQQKKQNQQKNQIKSLGLINVQSQEQIQRYLNVQKQSLCDSKQETIDEVDNELLAPLDLLLEMSEIVERFQEWEDQLNSSLIFNDE